MNDNEFEISIIKNGNKRKYVHIVSNNDDDNDKQDDMTTTAFDVPHLRQVHDTTTPTGLRKYKNYIKKPTYFDGLMMNPYDCVTGGHIDVYITKQACPIVLGKIFTLFTMDINQLYVRVRLHNDECPVSMRLKKFVLFVCNTIDIVVNKKKKTCQIAAGNIRFPYGFKCDDGHVIPTESRFKASMIPYDPKDERKSTIYSIKISLQDDEVDN